MPFLMFHLFYNTGNSVFILTTSLGRLTSVYLSHTSVGVIYQSFPSPRWISFTTADSHLPRRPPYPKGPPTPKAPLPQRHPYPKGTPTLKAHLPQCIVCIILRGKILQQLKYWQTTWNKTKRIVLTKHDHICTTPTTSSNHFAPYIYNTYNLFQSFCSIHIQHLQPPTIILLLPVIYNSHTFCILLEA